MILDGMSLATDGFASPVEGGDYCLAPFALISLGLIVLEVDEEPGKLADPRTREPWDPDYYRWKYRKQQSAVTKKRPEKEPEPEPRRPSFMRVLMERDLEAARTENAEMARLRELRIQNDQTERDIAELEAYIAEVTLGIESGIAAELAAQEAEILAQDELMARLEENVRLAREALLVVLEARRRHQNRIAAIEAVIRTYY